MGSKNVVGAELVFELPYPPSVNHYWRRVGSRTLISREGRNYRTAVWAETRGQVPGPLSGDLTVDVYLFPPDRRRRDVDNVAKSLLDALQHAGIYADDNQVRRLTLERCEVVEGGFVVVRIARYRPLWAWLRSWVETFRKLGRV